MAPAKQMDLTSYGGTIVSTLSLSALGAYFHFNGFAHADPWFGLLCIIVYIAGFAFSLGARLLADDLGIFPLRHRSKAMALSTVLNWAANFIVSYFFLQELDLIGKPWTFWLYGIVGVLAVSFF